MTTQISATELNARIAAGHRYQIVDVRSAQEYAEGHLPGALNLPMEQAEARVDDMHPHDPVVLVCQNGRRAHMTCDLLKPHRGDLLVLDGGTAAWVQAGLPVVKSVATRLPIMRQVQLGAGLMILTGTLLSLFVHPAWIAMAIFVGAGLTVAGATGFCGMAVLLGKMPWNRPTDAPTASAACAK